MTQEYKSFSPEEFRLHNEKLQAEMEKQDIDMLMLSTPENIYYSTGYRSWYTSSLFRPVYVLVPRKGDPAIILRILEKTTVYQLDQPHLLLGNCQQKPGASGGGGADQHH